jgi:hypothetical protein
MEGENKVKVKHLTKKSFNRWSVSTDGEKANARTVADLGSALMDV